MNQLIHWLHMGGYSIYIWSAYGLVFIVLGLNIMSTVWQKKRARKKLQQWFKKTQHDYDTCS